MKRKKDKFLDDIPDLGLGRKKHQAKKQTPEPANVLVQYISIKCPKCQGRRVPVYNSNNIPIRYHKCLTCGFRFKSIEIADPNPKAKPGPPGEPR